MTPNDPFMTQDKFNELTKDLVLLKQKRPHAVSEVARLAELGDFSENVEYQQAKGRLRGINNIILKIEYQLNHAEIIEAPKTGQVEIGSTVTVEIDSQTKIFTILGSSESNPSHGIISYSSPIGKMLFGKSVGETVELLSSENPKKYTILSIT